MKWRLNKVHDEGFCGNFSNHISWNLPPKVFNWQVNCIEQRGKRNLIILHPKLKTISLSRLILNFHQTRTETFLNSFTLALTFFFSSTWWGNTKSRGRIAKLSSLKYSCIVADHLRNAFCVETNFWGDDGKPWTNENVQKAAQWSENWKTLLCQSLKIFSMTRQKKLP